MNELLGGRFKRKGPADAHRVAKARVYIIVHHQSCGPVRSAPDHGPVGDNVADLQSLLELRRCDRRRSPRLPTNGTAAAPNNRAEDFKNLRRETESVSDITILPF